jgi:hypothetical protein
MLPRPVERWGALILSVFGTIELQGWEPTKVLLAAVKGIFMEDPRVATV